MSRKVALVVVEACLLWSVVLTGLAAIGNTWVLDRVAGGLYAGGAMPGGMRIVYLLTAVVSAAVMLLALRLYAGQATRVQRVLGWIVVAAFGLSTVVNAISPSVPERGNALPAALIVLGTAWLLRGSAP